MTPLCNDYHSETLQSGVFRQKYIGSTVMVTMQTYRFKGHKFGRNTQGKEEIDKLHIRSFSLVPPGTKMLM